MASVIVDLLALAVVLGVGYHGFRPNPARWRKRYMLACGAAAIVLLLALAVMP